jgi:nitrous oxide reductase accessory protein NosL
MNTKLCMLAAAALLLAAGCGKRAQAPGPAVTNPANVVDASAPLLGRWNGPEGTFLLLEGEGGKYVVTIQNLDGPRTFDGKGDGNTVTFVRDGKNMSIRPTNGAGTGMKWLAGRKDCVVIDTGEGYCRD